MSVLPQGPVNRATDLLCRVVLWISTTVIFTILVANTALRYTTGSSLQWAKEVPELLFPWMVMAGVVLAAQHGAHIATTFLVDALSSAVRRVVLTLGWLVVAALYLTLSVATYRMLEIVHDERTPILQVPGSVTYGCILVGMMMLAALALQAAWQAWRAKSATSDTVDQPNASA